MKIYVTSIRYIVAMGLLAGFSTLQAEPAVQPLSGDYSSGKNYQDTPKEGGKPARIQGKVLSMDTITLENDEPGVRLRVDVAGQEMDVHLGPRWFLNEHAVNLTEGQPVTIVGFTIRLDDQPAVIANELLQGIHRVPLRTPAGAPLWQKEKP